MTVSARESLKELIDYDDARASAPFEHTTAALAGLGLVVCAMRSRTRCGAVLQAVLGGVLLMRAASGQGGVRKWTHAPDADRGPELIVPR